MIAMAQWRFSLLAAWTCMAALGAAENPAAGAEQAPAAKVAFHEACESVALWTRAGDMGSAKVESLPPEEGGPRMVVRNGLYYAVMPKAVEGSFVVTMRMLHDDWQRLSVVWLTDVEGRKGYGVSWASGEKEQQNGEGVVALIKLDLNEAVAWEEWGKRSRLMPLDATSASPYVRSGRPAVGGKPAEFMWIRDGKTGRMGLWVDGRLCLLAEEKSFSEFQRIYLRGNGATRFGDIKVREASAEDLARLATQQKGGTGTGG